MEGGLAPANTLKWLVLEPLSTVQKVILYACRAPIAPIPQCGSGGFVKLVGLLLLP